MKGAVYMYRHKKNTLNKRKKFNSKDYHEEYSAEYMPSTRFIEGPRVINSWLLSLLIGYTGLVFSLLSLFMLPVLFGIIGTAIGIYTVTRGQSTLGYTAIGFGLFSMFVSFFYNLIFILSAVI
jgi:hypothetical protein